MTKLTKAIDGNTITFSFKDAGSFAVSLTGLDDTIIERLALHGLSQKIGDACSGEPDPTLSRGLCEAVASNIKNGLWAARTSAGGKLAQALSKVSGHDLAECIDVLARLDDKGKRALRKDAGIAKALLDIERERLASTEPTVDVGALFTVDA